jgi:hypothetical protein
MARHYDIDPHFGRAPDDIIEVVNLEPQQYPVSIWLVVTITNRAVMMFRFKTMQLKHELTL